MKNEEIIKNMIDNFDRKYPSQRRDACRQFGGVEASYLDSTYKTTKNGCKMKYTTVEKVRNIINGYEESMNYGLDNKKLAIDMIDYFNRKYPSKNHIACEMAGLSGSYLSATYNYLIARNRVNVQERTIDRIEFIINNYEDSLRGTLNET